MPFDWLKNHLKKTEKPENYAGKTLAAYALGMKAGGSIRGVRIELGEDACPAAGELPEGAIYMPEEAPRLPLESCPRRQRCTCIYRPVMTYDQTDVPAQEKEHE